MSASFAGASGLCVAEARAGILRRCADAKPEVVVEHTQRDIDPEHESELNSAYFPPLTLPSPLKKERG